MEDPASDPLREKDPYSSSKASKFQFKSTSTKRSKRSHNDHGRDDNEKSSSKRHRSDRNSGSRKHRHSKRRRTSRSDHNRTFTRNGEYDNPDHRHRESLYDGIGEEEVGSPNLSPDTAFRESLFDAMADDEGADYWAGVYGQPVHIYSNSKPGPDGKLERMSDEEYADYVRTKMWEKSHQHILEERAARERARKKKKERDDELEEEVARAEAEREEVRRRMEESLKRGEQRRKAKEAEAAWAKYLAKWDLLKSNPTLEGLEQSAREIIPWPVASGRATHVDKDEIEQFFKASHAWKDDAAAMLKIERVRWHPDKMQQRFGQHIDPANMRLVTAVFQVVDRLWNERNGRQK